MRLQHAKTHYLRLLLRRYPFLRRISWTTSIITLMWLYAIYWGERSTFAKHIEACSWGKWEEWPRDATPHHLVFIADPQLVDPHTYPGRPWPLSMLTEQYTDLYMSRNFRLINSELDPDSVVFLGDLFDGGREWAPAKARKLTRDQKSRLQDYGVIPREPEIDKRSTETYTAALTGPQHHQVTRKENNPGPDGQDLKEFIPGENGRWKRWGDRQWKDDLRRFARIFWDPEQLYPTTKRQILPIYEVDADPIAIENGADNVTWKEYATTGDKTRRVMTSLPGNHDLGFGSGVQLAIRDRFQTHFGDGNRIDIIGNHTFISIDTPSLAAHSEFLRQGGQTLPERAHKAEHIWKPSMDFIDNLQMPTAKLISKHLQDYYPREETTSRWPHAVVAPGEKPVGDKSTPNKQSTSLHSVFGKKPMTDQSTSKKVDTLDTTKPSTPRRELALPVILLSHVPLYRLPGADCGHLRERGSAIPIAIGYQYQNVLTQSLSREIITKVSTAGEIVHAFSGDDHDYCDITHKFNIGSWSSISTGDAPAERKESSRTTMKQVREITVKSFSWAMGVRKPGFQLVSLWNPVDAKGETVGIPLPTIQSHLCLLPDQLEIFIDYALFFALTLVVLLLQAIVTPLLANLDPESEQSDPSNRWGLPKYQQKPNGKANGKSPLQKIVSMGRRRASSTSTSTTRSQNGSLGVQRNLNARTRSVSPAVPYATEGKYQPVDFKPQPGSLIEKAGYFPKVSWQDPDEESDEEAKVGDLAFADDDSQMKWKRHRREHGKAWSIVNAFWGNLVLVGAPCFMWYIWLIRHG